MFKEFAMREKEHMAMKKHALLRQEKDGIINDFKSFSQTFKVGSIINIILIFSELFESLTVPFLLI